MSRPTFPEPESTPEGPSYEGRLLDRANDEVVDQGVRFDLRTLVTRRSVLTVLGIGAGAAVLSACTDNAPRADSTSTAPTSTRRSEIPEETPGPFPGNGSNGPDALETSGIVRRDIRSSTGGASTASGVPMTLTLTVLDRARRDIPFEDVAVYVWHCDSAGRYSLYSDGIRDENYLRGVQVADRHGEVTFESIFPGCYEGRWPHVHFEVYPTRDSIGQAASVIATSQVALPQGVSEAVYRLPGYEGSTGALSRVSLRSDMVFGDDGGALQLATVTGDSRSGYRVALPVLVDTRTP